MFEDRCVCVFIYLYKYAYVHECVCVFVCINISILICTRMFMYAKSAEKYQENAYATFSL